jgi:hypothetical protein
LVAGIALGALGTRWLDAARPLASASPSPTASTAPSGPPVTTLVWSATPFLTPDAKPHAITAVGERLIVTGKDRGGPAAWTSDDGGATWVRSPVRGLSDEEAEWQALGKVASHAGRLVALGLPQGEAAFISEDLGTTWRRSGHPLPAGAVDIAAGPAGFVVVGDLRGFGPTDWSSGGGLALWEAGAWVSSDGELWQTTGPLSSKSQPRSVVNSVSVRTISGRTSLVAAVGYYEPGFPEDSASIPSVWLSADGRDWDLVNHSGLGTISEIIAGPSGFIAVGSTVEGTCRATAWHSADGHNWDAVQLDLSCGGRGSDANDVAATWSGLVTVGFEYGGLSGRTPVWWVPRSSHAAYEQDVAGYLYDITSLGDTFVAIGDCGAKFDDHCGPMLFAGRLPTVAP